MYIEIDDFRQAFVVAKNEVRKFVRGKRFTLFIVLIGLVFALLTFLPYAFGSNVGDTPEEVALLYVSFASLLVILAATLFSSVTIVSEFEERTALILFTRPIKKTSIFIGKIAGCLFIEMAVISLFYVGIVVVSLAATGSVTKDLLASFGYCMLFILAASGIAIMISSVMKKGSTCAILTFILLLLILPIISEVIILATDVEPWFMLDQASNAMFTTVAGYSSWGIPIEKVDALKTITAMIVWTAASLILAWISFIKREF